MAAKIEPWDRQEGEGATPYQQFCVFKDMTPPRNLKAVSEVVGRGYGTVSFYSRKYNWFDRAALWDDHLAKRVNKAVTHEAEKMAREHLTAAHKAIILGTTALSRYIKRANPDDENDDNPVVSAKDALAMVEKGIALERLILGEATNRTESKDLDKELDLSRLSAEKRAMLLGLLAEAGCVEDD